MALQINIGTEAHSSDGHGLGDVDQLVIDGATNALSYLIVGSHLVGSGKLVPLSAVASADGESVKLSATKDDFEQMTTFVEKEFIQMRDASLYAGGGVSMPMAESGWMMVGPGSGDIPATGGMGLVAPSISGEVVTSILSTISENSVRIDEGTDVVDKEFEKIGRVDQVFVSDDGIVTGFIMKQGRLIRHDVEIPIAWVAGIASEHIRLNLSEVEVESEVKQS